ncbi:quinone-dependent dihydroorotate dehydrogenase [Caulobacter sp. S45]|uniref:quinone-dependent dihydroorotate dehydrogenase n=1 Tax=Caulobacter sp. S45 TaxID=1641861 RepID=UPI00157750E3|nr:quinone-dependent dihydroorotate dehydrogenase [Caulobacter sp. S45]
MLHDLAARTLRLMEPEAAHHLSLRALKAGLGPRDRGLGDPALSVRLAGMDLPNCIGLAAGYDKDAEVFNPMLAAGFGFVECGTVTPLSQAGNPGPRLFRLPRDRAVINRMGFNNGGLEDFARRLETPREGIVGANLGANKDATDRIGDYVTGLQRLWGRCDYFAINVSSPNTPGLRNLQARAALEELAGRLREAREALNRTRDYPLMLKVAPDLKDQEVADIVSVAAGYGLNGIIVSNTTVERPQDLRSSKRTETGGLSGAPLMSLSTRTLRRFHDANANAHLALIGAGGIASAEDIYAKVRAGACAVQLYTALVYSGPGLVRRLKRDLARRLRSDGFASIFEAKGAV